jgi:hypothetical protein
MTLELPPPVTVTGGGIMYVLPSFLDDRARKRRR